MGSGDISIGTHGSIRASDADRAAVAARLADAVGDGRLSVGEYDERLAAAYAATTRGELDALTADLPVTVLAPVAPAAAPLPARCSAWVEPWRAWISANIFFVAIWAWGSIASEHLIFFWPGFLMLLSGVGIAKRSLDGRH